MRLLATALVGIFATALVGIFAAACGQAPPAAASPVPSVSASSDAQQAVARARADAASRTAIEPDRWQLLEASAREWPDAGLGCPEAGTTYAQVLTPGYLIRLRAEGRTLEYHSGPGRVVYCGG